MGCSTARLALAVKRVRAHRSSGWTAASGRRTRTESSRPCWRRRSPPGWAETRESIYRDLTREFGEPVYDRVEAPATPAQKELLGRLSPRASSSFKDLAGEKIQAILTHAPGNGAPIGGLKVVAKSGWFAARPSGTESIYKIYAESFNGAEHLRRILEEAQTIVSEALAAPRQQSAAPPEGRLGNNP